MLSLSKHEVRATDLALRQAQDEVRSLMSSLRGPRHVTANKTLLILPGDGIGTEVMREVRRVVDWFDKRRAVRFDITEGLVGGASIDANGTPITDATMARAMDADAVLMGAVGGPKWDSLPFAQKPERGLLRLRKDMELFANLRPAMVFEALVDASSLKPELVRGLDILIVRELTGGVYFGTPRGIEILPDGTRRGINTQVYTTPEIIRVARVAFDLAKLRGNKVCSVEKANVMESGVLWREEVQKLHDAEYGDVALSHMYADNCAMQLVRQPKQFDVIVTDNLFGDLLSDCAAMLTGSLGMLPSASLGATDATGRRRALYEPVHGSAPDIAGKDLANPLATLLSFAMLLRYSFGLTDDADLVEKAVENVLAAGIRTADIATPGTTKVSTTSMGTALLGELDRLAA
jgi:3-isopropylmalate dehydrogenase